MKYVLTTAFVLMSSAAHAENVNSRIQDHYVNETISIPTRVNECRDVEVPIYGEQRNGASGGDVLAGMILGGLLGKGITGDDGGAAAGAVMGGVVAADRGGRQQVITGYRMERQCFEDVIYQSETRRVYSHSTITFVVDGKRKTVEFQK